MDNQHGVKPQAQDDKEPIYIGNIGEGDDNADWIKLANGGRGQRQDLAAHHTIMIRHYQERGEHAKAERERELETILIGHGGDGDISLAEHHAIMVRYFDAIGETAMAQRHREKLASLQAP